MQEQDDQDKSATPEMVLQTREDFRQLLDEATRSTRKDLKGGATEVALYATERAAYLATLVGQRGFDTAVIAERDNVAAKAALVLGKQASAADARIVGIIQGMLFFGAKRLAGI